MIEFTMETLLTISIPTLNRPAEIVRHFYELSKLSDVLKQKIQLLVCDNGSNTFNHDLINNLGLNFNHYKQPFNVGFGKNIESCITLAEGKYVWLMGDDDKIVIDKLEKLINFIEHKEFDYLTLTESLNNQKNTQANSNSNFSENWKSVVFIANSILNTKYAKNVLHDIKDVGVNDTYQHVLLAIPILDQSKSILFIENEFVIDTHTIKNYNFEASFNVHIRDFLKLERQLLKINHKGSSLPSLSRFINAKLINHSSKLIFTFKSRSNYLYFVKTLLDFGPQLFMSWKRFLSFCYAFSMFLLAILSPTFSRCTYYLLLKMPKVGVLLERDDLHNSPTLIKSAIDDSSISGYGTLRNLKNIS